MSEDKKKVEDLLQTILEVVEDGRVGRAIREAARKGSIEYTQPNTENNTEYWDALRQTARVILYRYWNEYKVPLEIWNGIALVKKEVQAMVADGKAENDERKYWKWPGCTGSANFEVTVKRRFNELQSAKFYKERFDAFPPAISWMQSHKSYYIPNPHFLSKEIREEIETTYHERLYGEVKRGDR